MGPYEILAPIGAGGMGEVYRARDHKLLRDVAIKTLPEVFAGDPERLARFRHEARVLASLNHPNIAAIYGLEEFFGMQFLVMELVEGETLSQRIAKDAPIPIEEAISLCGQVAEGLEAAHLKGVTHRDVKPANVKVTPEGRVKVLDFGLAKAIFGGGTTQDLSQAQTITEFGTEYGRVLGTPSYMSPEQARGKGVDKRTDIWSFGCLLFELLTRKKAFPGETVSDTLAAILERQPAWDSLPAATPGRIRELLQGCLQKDANLRVQDMRSAIAAVKEAGVNQEPRLFTRRVVAALLVSAALAGAVALPGVRRPLINLISPSRFQQEKHLAVLPFTNVGGDPADQVFCDGVVESLTTSLTQLERFQNSLFVVPASEVRRLSSSSVRDAAATFGVNLVVTGSIQRTGSAVRLTVNLVDARTLRQLGARSVDIPREELSKMEDRLLDLVAELLDLSLQPQARTALNLGGTSVSDAYEAYLRGRGYLRRYDKQGNVELAIAAFKEALRRDTRYALAYTGLGEAYWRNFDRTKSPEWLELAQEANASAIDLNDRLALAHVNLGMTYASSGRYKLAVEQFQRALDLDSLNPDAYRELAGAYEAMNQIKDAEDTYNRALRLRPNDWLNHSRLGGFYYRRGQYEKAERPFLKVIALTPDNVNGYSNLGGLYVAWGRYDLAESLLKKAIQVKPTDPRGYSNLGTLYFERGQYGEAVHMFEQAVDKNPGPNYATVGNLADSYRWAPGFESKAPQTYQRAIDLAEQQLAINPNNAGALSSAAVYRAKLARKEEALHDITLARELAPADKTVSSKAIIVFELLGRRPEALAALRELLKGGFALDQIESDPELKKFRQDQAYIRMVSKDAPGNASPTLKPK